MKPNLTFSKLALFPMGAVLSAIIIGTSCQKASVREEQPSNFLDQQKLEITNTFIEAASDDEENFDMVMEDETTDADNVSNAKVAGKTVTYSPSKNVYPHTKTIDFGTGFTTANGVTKSGKVIITYYDAKADANGKYSVTTYDNFYVNHSHVEGSIQVNKIKNGTGKKVYLHLIHKTISDANGNVRDFNTNSQWTVIDWQGGKDNAYEITEHSTGKQIFKGTETSFVTDTEKDNPIIKPFKCKRVQGGLNAKVKLAHSNLNEYLDYGNGSCDTKATLSVNGGPAKEVNLPLRFWPLNL